MSKVRTKRGGGTLGDKLALRYPITLIAGVTFAVLLFWIGFTAGVKSHELLVGACATGLTLALFLNVLRTEKLHFRLSLPDLLLVRQVPAAILKDCWALLLVLVADLTGKKRAGSYYRVCGFRTSTHDPLLIGRSALAIAFTTASPNMIVIGIDPAQSLIIFHQLQRDAVPSYTQALGASHQHSTPPRQSGDAK